MTAHAAFARMIATRALSMVAMVAGFAALGRLLTPEDFGRFALAGAFLAAARVVSEFGLRSFLVREREIDAEAAG